MGRFFYGILRRPNIPDCANGFPVCKTSERSARLHLQSILAPTPAAYGGHNTKLI